MSPRLQVTPPSVDLRTHPGAPQFEPLGTGLSPVAASMVVTPLTVFEANRIWMVAVAVPTATWLVNVGTGSSALVVRQIPPSFVGGLKPFTPAIRMFGVAPKAMSVIPRLPPFAGWTVILVNRGSADMALVLRYNPRLGRLASSTEGIESAPIPPMPDVVETKTTLSSVGLTSIRVIARPVNTSLPVVSRLKGPSSWGVESACLMMYSPTPEK